MAKYTQEGRLLRVETPLGPDVLLLSRFSGQEEMSRLFFFRLEMFSEDDSIQAKDIVGKNVTFAIKGPEGPDRLFNGFVSSFSYAGTGDRLSTYRADVVPWLWFLTRNANCRIFQNKSVPKIIEQLFSEQGFSDYEASEITGAHPEWEYCVQYRETDFNFISRLMEQEGIFYYFRHENGKHVLVLADSKSAFKDCVEKEVAFSAPQGASTSTDLITSWEHKYEYTSGRFAQTDYNFETPTASLLTKSSTVVKLDGPDRHEVFDFPGEYEKKEQGDAETKIRMEEIESAHEVVSGSSFCRTFTPGGKFTLTKHPSKVEEGKVYVVTSIVHAASQASSYTSGGSLPPADYSNKFTCIPEGTTFRPARSTAKPAIKGSQTAVVVGPSGEEIFTDKHGRVKVQFHWDREGQNDEKSSCWIRVAQSLAGKKWGCLHLPRVGQEVVVSFLEGDPDRPLVTGSVYNAEQVPPYDLPANKTMSVLKSNSSKGGGGFNEIRFEDKKGDEQIFVHAEKNLDVRVKNDVYEWAGNDRHVIVKNDRVEHVENNLHETIDNDLLVKIGRDANLTVSGKECIEISGSHSFTVNGDVIETFKANHSEKTTSNYYVSAMGVVIEAMQGLTLKAGPSSVVIDASGVTLKGPTVTIDGIMTKINSGPGSPPASGQAGSAVAPASPKAPEEADKADPGQMAQVKAQQRETQTGKYGAVPIKPFKPDETKKSWIEIELVDEENNPVAGERYRITLPDGSTTEGTLDDKGVAHVGGIDPGTAQVTFPDLDGDAWGSA